jgi:YesN/AraC family two-component response regulator
MLYVLQLAYLILEFIKQVKLYKAKLADYYSDYESRRFQWVKVAFISVMPIAFLSVWIQIFTDIALLLFFNVSCIIFYLYFAIRYINYLYEFYLIAPLFESEDKVIEKEEDTIIPLNWSNITEAIEHWVENKGYIVPGITIVAVATELNTNRTYLSNYINTQKEMSFNEWINLLRIEEAKRLIMLQPNTSIAEISETVGYAHISNFGRQFSKITGHSPATWRKDQLATSA